MGTETDGQPTDAHGRLIDSWLDQQWLEKGLSEHSLSNYRRDISQLAVWLQHQQATLLACERYQLLEFLAARHQQGLSARSVARQLSAVKSFYRWLKREGRIAEDPALLIERPKLGRPLPKTLSEADVEALLAAPDLSTPLGLRDRAMLEVLYATGLRVTELVTLTQSQINPRQGLIRVIGKGDKERLVPLGEEALHWLGRYAQEGRPQLLAADQQGGNQELLFPSRRGTCMTRQTFWHRIKQLAVVAGVQKKLSPLSLIHI